MFYVNVTNILCTLHTYPYHGYATIDSIYENVPYYAGNFCFVLELSNHFLCFISFEIFRVLSLPDYVYVELKINRVSLKMCHLQNSLFRWHVDDFTTDIFKINYRLVVVCWQVIKEQSQIISPPSLAEDFFHHVNILLNSLDTKKWKWLLCPKRLN